MLIKLKSSKDLSYYIEILKCLIVWNTYSWFVFDGWEITSYLHFIIILTLINLCIHTHCTEFHYVYHGDLLSLLKALLILSLHPSRRFWFFLGYGRKKVSITLLADYLFFIKHALMLKSSMVDQIHFSVKSRAIINKKRRPYSIKLLKFHLPMKMDLSVFDEKDTIKIPTGAY